MSWTEFRYMRSSEEPVAIFEAEEEEAIDAFREMFRIDPEATSCPCCGPDYSIGEYDDLETITGFGHGEFRIYRKDSSGNFFLDFQDAETGEEIENE